MRNKQIRVLGATQVGPVHLDQGLPNQDAYFLFQCRKYSLAVVCDGMGSAKYAEQGAKAATQAVHEAVHIWANAGAINVDRLLKLIHSIWNIKIEQWEARQAATTCLFAILFEDGSGWLAQLGDGLALARLKIQGLLQLSWNKSGYSNETDAMGTVKNLSAWQTRKIDNFGEGDCILLCTDGISEDIVHGKEAEFVDFLHQKYKNIYLRRAAHAFQRELQSWPTENHADDKTMCLLWK